MNLCLVNKNLKQNIIISKEIKILFKKNNLDRHLLRLKDL